MLFYWDSRDGKDLNGWWFGDKIGGGQVWARALDMSISPPSKGWKCPVDGPVNKHVVCVPKMRSAGEEPATLPTMGMKRAAPSIVESAAKHARGLETLVLGSSLGEKAPKAVVKIVGEYVEDGENHGKKCYKRIADESGDQSVHLYFWDQRDGWDCSGWWFGNRVGGAQVYARATEPSASPPEKGWKVPHDENRSRSDVSLVPKASEEDVEMTETDRLDKVKEMVGELETSSEKALENARPLSTAKGGLLEEGVRAVHDILHAQVENLMDAKYSISRHSKAAMKQGGSDEIQNMLTAEEERIDENLGKVKEALGKAREELQEVEIAGAEEKDTAKFDSALAIAMEAVVKVEAAADDATCLADAVSAEKSAKAAMSTVMKCLNASKRYAPEARKTAEAEFGALRDRCRSVEKRMAHFDVKSVKPATSATGGQAKEEKEAAFAALPSVSMAVEQAEEDVNGVATSVKEQKAGQVLLELLGNEGKQVVEETQRAADKAQDSIGAARAATDNLAKAAKQLSIIDQKSLLEDIAQLRKRTADAQKKLNPFKKARLEFNQKLILKQETERFNADMTILEKEVADVAKVLAEAPSEIEVTSAESSLPTLLATLSAKMRAVDEKVSSASGSSAAALLAILERAKEAKSKIESLKTSSKDRRKELKAESLLKSAEKEVANAEEWAAKMSKVEEPWAGNVEVVPEETALPALDACAALAEQAEPAIKASKAFVAEKLVDVRQVPEGPLRFDTQQTLLEMQDRVEKVAMKATQLKIDTYARRTLLQMTTEIIAVSGAEDKVQKVVDVAKPLDEDYLGKGAEPKGLKAACKKILDMDGAAAKECTKAKAVIEAKKNDPKFGISPSFRTQLLKLGGRIDAAEKKLAMLKDAAKIAGDSAKKFKAQKDELDTLVETVDKIELEALPLGDEAISDESNKNMAELIFSTGDQLHQWLATAESMASSHSHGSLRHAMKELASEGTKLRSRLKEAREMAGDRLNSTFCKIFLREGKGQIEKAEEAIKKTDVAEGPYLKGVDKLPADQAAKAISQCEAAAVSAKAVFAEVGTFFKVHLSEVRGYCRADASLKPDAMGLAELSGKVDTLKAKLDQFIKDTEQRKKS
jgi:hypothetical protein